MNAMMQSLSRIGLAKAVQQSFQIFSSSQLGTINQST